jgi:hypothetical protein
MQVAYETKMHTNSWSGNLKGRNHFERCRYRKKVNGNCEKDFRARVYDTVDWIHTAQDKDPWWALVNNVMDLRVPQYAGNYLQNAREKIYL